MTIRLLLATIALAFIATCVSAQETDTPNTPRYLKISMGTFAGAAAADDASTWRFAKYHRDALQEGDPLVAGLDHHPVLLTGALVSMDTVGMWAWQHYVGRKHPRLAAIGFYAAAAVRTGIAIRNLRKMAALSGPPPPGWSIPMAPYW